VTVESNRAAAGTVGAMAGWPRSDPWPPTAAYRMGGGLRPPFEVSGLGVSGGQ